MSQVERQAEPLAPHAIFPETLAEFDHKAARREGWALIECGALSDGAPRVELRPLSAPAFPLLRFENDRDVWSHVVAEARKGSLLHLAALELVDRRERMAITAHCGVW